MGGEPVRFGSISERAPDEQSGTRRTALALRLPDAAIATRANGAHQRCRSRDRGRAVDSVVRGRLGVYFVDVNSCDVMSVGTMTPLPRIPATSAPPRMRFMRSSLWNTAG